MMRGPENEAIDDPPVRPPALRTRLPGGKPLLRLLHQLGAAGYEAASTEAIAAALDEFQQDPFRDLAAGLVPLPSRNGTTPPPQPGEGDSKTTPEDAARASIAAAEFLGPPTATGPQWRSVGPTTVTNGQTYGTSRVNVSGRVSAIASDPGNPAHVLVGAANGGVWESFDRGGSWAPRSDYAATTTIGAIAFDPSSTQTVYCGTGEGNWWWWLGAGVLRSTDGGSTWTSRCTDPFVGTGFYDLEVNPGDSQRLVAATMRGLYTSADAGVTWTQRRAATSWSIAHGTSEILAACNDGIRLSTDNGATFPAVALPGAPSSFTRLAVAIAPSDATIAYAWGAGGPFDANGNPTAYLWRRAAGTWTTQTIPPGVGTWQAWYDWFLAVAPDNANQIYLGAISAWRGTLSGVTWTWLDIATKASGDSIHPDQHAIAFEPGNPNAIYIGNDGGLFRSPDRGVNWAHRNNGLVISEYEYIGQNLGTSRWLLGGTQDNGTNRWRGSPVWEHVADGDGGDCGVNRGNPDTVFHTFYTMTPQRSTSGGAWGTWANIYPPLPTGESSPFYPPFECSATTGDTIAMAGQALYVSRNNGTNWTRLAFPSAGTATAMYIPNGDTVLVGLNDGRVLRATWGSTAWAASTALSTPRANAAVSDIEVDANNNSRIWVTYSTVGGGRVYRSNDGGTTWVDRTAGLPNLPITAIALDPRNPNRVWVSASLGVYQTIDGGGSWAGFASNLPNAYVGDLIYHRHARVLRAGLRNRGVWEIPVDGWMTTPVCGTQWNESLAGNEQRKWFTFNWPATWHVVWTVMPTSVRAGAPQVAWQVQVERANPEYVTYWITVSNLTPETVTFEGRFCILSRY